MYEVEKNWITKAGLRAVVIAGSCHRCGYVGVGQNHKLYGVHYSTPTPEITQQQVDKAPANKLSCLQILTATVDSDDGESVRRSPDMLLNCHGGLTYSGGGGLYPINFHLWWFGFDCGHYGDGLWGDMAHLTSGPVRSQAYVEQECESLAEQLAAL